jgi:hypothetical protein
MGAKDAGAIQEELIMKYVIRPVQQCIDDAGRNCVLEVFIARVRYDIAYSTIYTSRRPNHVFLKSICRYLKNKQYKGF